MTKTTKSRKKKDNRMVPYNFRMHSRKYNCVFYDECLNVAALHNKHTIKCDNCRRYKPIKISLDHQTMIGCLHLLHEVFREKGEFYVKGLSRKQLKFCREYLIDSNVTQAAIRAGYDGKSAHRTGKTNMKNPKILYGIELLRELQKEI